MSNVYFFQCVEEQVFGAKKSALCQYCLKQVLRETGDSYAQYGRSIEKKKAKGGGREGAQECTALGAQLVGLLAKAS